MRFFAWLRNWVRTAIAASSRKDFYRHLDDRKPGEAIGHLALLATFLYVLPALILFFMHAPAAAKAVMEGLRTRVPAGTVFEMKDHVLSSTLSEPLVFDNNIFMHVIIDSASSTIALREGESSLVINATGVALRDPFEERSFSFKKWPDFRWTREDMLDGIPRWTPLALFLGAFVIMMVVLGMVWVNFLAAAALHALVLWFVLKIGKHPWPWKRAFVASAYAATGPIVLNAFLSAAGLGLGFVSSLLYWLILIWIAYDHMKKTPLVSEKEIEPPPENR